MGLDAWQDFGLFAIFRDVLVKIFIKAHQCLSDKYENNKMSVMKLKKKMLKTMMRTTKNLPKTLFKELGGWKKKSPFFHPPPQDISVLGVLRSFWSIKSIPHMLISQENFYRHCHSTKIGICKKFCKKSHIDHFWLFKRKVTCV